MIEDFGPYRIVRRLAVGGMAEIYLARQRGIEGVERTVVLKRILPSFSTDDEFVTMFLDEARLMAALAHPNIAQVFDLGKVEDSYYLVMEYVRGPALGGLHKAALRAGEKSLPEKEVLGITLGIAEALAYTHELRDELGRPLNVVHRDLNPANVLVSYDGAVKLIDFGIAKTATKVYETRTGVIKGTYGYIAPEQLTRSGLVDHRADVFALGVLLYEMAVGQHPFDASDEPNLIDRILRARYRRPRQVVPTFPKALDVLIAACLEPDPKNRPANVRTFIAELIAYLVDKRTIPTMGDIAALTRRLVPDKEGPVPLRPLTQKAPKPRHGRSPATERNEPTNTMRLGAQAEREVPSGDQTLRVDVPRDVGAVLPAITVRDGAPPPMTPRDSPSLPPLTPDDLDDAADTLIAGNMHQNRPVRARPPARGGRSEHPLPRERKDSNPPRERKDSNPPRDRKDSNPPRDRKIESSAPKKKPSSVPPKREIFQQPKRRPWLVAIGSVSLIGAAFGGAYVAAQAIQDNPFDTSQTNADAQAAVVDATVTDVTPDVAPQLWSLRITSRVGSDEVQGATVAVQAQRGDEFDPEILLDGGTPLTYEFPEGTTGAYVTVKLAGFFDRQQRVLAGAPEAVLYLEPQEQDAGAADAADATAEVEQADAGEEQDEPPNNRRQRRRRRNN